MLGVLMTSLRKNIIVPGIDVSWDTNLSDEEIRVAYQQLQEQDFFIHASPANGSLTITEKSSPDLMEIAIESNNLNFEVQVGSKMCRGTGIKKWIHIVYRSEFEWAQIDKEQHRNEVVDAEREVRLTHRNNVAILVLDHHMNGYMNIEDNNYEAAENDFLSALQLLIDHEQEPDMIFGFRKDGLSVHPVLNLLKLYGESRKIIKGIDFIRNFAKGERLWLHFGEILERDQQTEMASSVYREALRDHSLCADLYKRSAITFQRLGDLRSSIDICRTAIEKGLTDDGTKSGFKGRLKRLEKASINK